MICNTCQENHCRARELVYVKKAFPIPNHIEENAKAKYIRILQKKAEDTGMCRQYCDIPMSSPDFHIHRREISAGGY